MKTVEPLLEKLSMLDLSKLSEQQRRVVVVEIKSHLDHFVPEDDPNEAWLGQRVLLLKYWHELVKLRLADVRANVEPPQAPIKLKPFLTQPPEPPAPVDHETDHDALDSHTVDSEIIPDDHGSINEIPEQESYVPLPRSQGQEDWVDVMLTEPGIIRGMQLPAGITVTVSPEDGEHIVMHFKGRLLTPDNTAINQPE